MRSKVIAFLILLCLALSFTVAIVTANPGSNTVNLNFHKTGAQTLWTGNTTTQIMNTTSTGYWSASAQSVDFVIPANETYYNTTFFVYPKLAGALSATSGSFEVYLNSTKPIMTSVWIHSYYTTNGNTNTSLYSGVGSNATVITAAATLVTIAGGSASVTIGADYYIFATVSICIKNDTDTVTLWYDTTTMNSRFTLVAEDVVTTSLSSDFQTYERDDAAILTATVTDVFGGYDIASATVLFTNPSGLSYTLAASSYGDAQYSNTYVYTISKLSVVGQAGTWTPTVTTTDRSGNSFTSSYSFVVTTESGSRNWDPDLSPLSWTGTPSGDTTIVVVGLIVGICGLLLWYGTKKPRRGHKR